MKKLFQNPSTLVVAALVLSAFLGLSRTALTADKAAAPYKILATTQIPAAGGIDYVTADSLNRRVYVACGNAVSVFDLDTYKLAGTLPKGPVSAHVGETASQLTEKPEDEKRERVFGAGDVDAGVLIFHAREASSTSFVSSSCTGTR